MYAIIEIGGQQFKVEKDKEIFVNKLDAEAGASVDFDKVLLVDNGGSVQVGTPTVAGSAVKGTVVEHLKGDKTVVFKKKRRKGYKVKNGFRASLTKVKIEAIG